MSRGRGLLISVGIAAIIAGIPAAGFAGTVGNTANIDDPKGPGIFSMRQKEGFYIKSAFDMEFLFDRDIHASAASGAELTSAQWYMGKISCVLFNRVEPYLRLGIAHMKARWTEAGTKVELESNTDFAWGVGSKVLLWDFKRPRLKLIGDGFYRVADLDGEEGISGGSKAVLDTAKSRFVLREWQIALLAAIEVDVGGTRGEDVLGVSKMVPYAGVKYSDINGRIRLEHTSGSYNNPGDIESDDNFGFFAGCDFVGPNSISLNVEGRIIDEAALTAGIAVMF